MRSWSDGRHFGQIDARCYETVELQREVKSDFRKRDFSIIDISVALGSI